MAVLPIYTYGQPVLRQKARAVSAVSDDVVMLIMKMFETMRKASGVGLAANQVGRLDRVIVIDVSDVDGYKDIKPLAIINPEIVGRTGSCTMEEGCLSIPDVRDEVERTETIKLRYKDSNFKTVELEASGLLARAIQHEIDHINGVLFLDHLTDEKRKRHTEELEKIQRGEVDVDYPVLTAAAVAA
jgi:peptide deformylase